MLAQAEDDRLPLLERVRFLCITSSNLDEFFEVRVAGLKEQLRLNPSYADDDGLPVGETLDRVAHVRMRWSRASTACSTKTCCRRW